MDDGGGGLGVDVVGGGGLAAGGGEVVTGGGGEAVAGGGAEGVGGGGGEVVLAAGGDVGAGETPGDGEVDIGQNSKVNIRNHSNQYRNYGGENVKREGETREIEY